MSSRKFIMLFEEFKAIGSFTWTDVRDALQLKKPFMIIIFKDENTKSAAVANELNTYDIIDQSAFLKRDGELIEYPSVFFVLPRTSDLTQMIRSIFEQYEAKNIVHNDGGSEYSDIYYPDGSSIEAGNEIESTIEPDEFKSGDYFKIGSTYYRFLDGSF